MRGASLASGVVAGVAGAGAAEDTGAAAGAKAAAAVPMGRGTGVLPGAGGGGGTAAGGGGGGVNVRGSGTLASGRGIGTLPGFARSGADVGGGCDASGRAGRSINTVSSCSSAATSPRRGGRTILVVSFLGSLASAMVTLMSGIISLPKTGYVVTGELRDGR